MEACFAFAVIFVIMLAILGVAYGFFAATVAIQRIWQRHYHILTKKELTKASSPAYKLKCLHSSSSVLSQGKRVINIIVFVFGDTQEYVVEDLPGGYTPPKMDPEHEQRLKVLQLL